MSTDYWNKQGRTDGLKGTGPKNPNTFPNSTAREVYNGSYNKEANKGSSQNKSKK